MGSASATEDAIALTVGCGFELQTTFGIAAVMRTTSNGCPTRRNNVPRTGRVVVGRGHDAA